MVVIIMTNAQKGTACFGGNEILASNYGPKPFSSYGVSIPQKPIFGVALNCKNTTKTSIFGLRMLNCGRISALSKGECDNQSVGGGVFERELEFKPSFDEYLKAMETIKEKKQARKSKRDGLKDNSSVKGCFRTQLVERDEEIGKLGKIEGYPDREKMSKVVEQDGNVLARQESVVRSKFGYEKRGIQDFEDKLNGKESDRGLKLRRLWGEKVNGNLEPAFGKGKGIYIRNVQPRVMLNAVKKTGNEMGTNGGLSHDKSSLKMLEMKGPYGSHRGLERSTIERKKFNTKTDGTFGINPIQVKKVINKEIASKNGKLTRSSKAFLKKDEDGGLETERAAFRHFDEFNDVVDKPRLSRMEMEERIQKLAKWLNGADIDMPEWMFSKMMRSAKIRFSDHSMLRVIQILGKLGNWRRVLQVIEWLQMRERFKSHKLRYVYTAALDVLGKARRPVEALNVFHAMQQQMSSYPDSVAYHSIAVTLGQAGHMKELFDVIDSMRSPPKNFKPGALGKWDPQLEPDIVIYNAVLNACVRRKQWEGAFWVLQQLQQQGQQPSTTTYGLVMEVMFACGKYNLVHEFFRKVQKSSIPNAITFRVLVNTLWREDKTDEAVLAVRDMESRGIVGSAALYYDLARCLCSAGRCQEALMQIDKICKVANKPLVVTCTGLIQACLDVGNIHNAAFIFNQMEKFCSPNLVTCNIMMKAYLMHRMFEEAKELFQKMSEDGNHISSKSDYRVRVIPDIYTFNIMLEACIAEKRWDDFEHVYEKMLQHGFHFNEKRHLRMILDASRSGKGGLLERTWNHLVQARRDLPPSLIKERFIMQLEKDHYVAALSSIANLQESESQPLSKKVWLNLLKENAHRIQRDALIRLIHEVSILDSGSDVPNPVLQNLLTSCKEFLRTRE